MGSARFTRAKRFFKKVAIFVQICYHYPSDAETSSFACHQKKVLALVLAFACAFTMFAGAAFTDEADIKAKDAVNMLTALGVIDGYSDGSFKPDGTVTRAEMAKMIFVVRNNSIDDSAYANVASKLTDITNHWAKGYIKFCESQGIVSGKSATKFDPDAVVTGTEAAKMLLVLAGYEPSKAGLEGAAWATNTLKYAGAAGILDDVGSGLSSGLPRQYAAQMIYNTLDAYRVKWSTDSNSFDNILNGGVKETVGAAYMGLVYDVGSLVEVDKDSLKIVLNSSYEADNYHGGSGSQGFTKVGQDYSDLLGQTVKVMFKDGKTNNVLGVFAVSDNTAVTINRSAVDTDVKKLDLNGTKYSVASAGINVYQTNGDTATWANAAAAKEADAAKTANVVTFIDANGDGNIETAVERVIDVKKVTSVSSSSIVAGGKTYKFDDHNIAEGVAKGDYVAITDNMYDDCMDIYVVDKVTGKIDGTKANETAIDGTWYWNYKDLDKGDINAGNKVDAYVLNGVLFSAEKVSGTAGVPDVAMIIDVGTGYNADQVYMMFTDGSKKRVEYETENSVNGTVTTHFGAGSDTATDKYVGPLAAGMLVEYSVSGDTYTLKPMADGVEYGDYTFNKGNASDVTGSTDVEKIGGLVVDDNAKIFAYENGTGNFKVITGKQLKTLTLTTEVVATSNGWFKSKVDGLERATVAGVQIAAGRWNVTDNFDTQANYGYITSDAYTSASGYITFGLWTGAEQKTVTFKSSSASSYTKGTVIGYSTIEESNEIKDVTAISMTAGSLVGATAAGTKANVAADNVTGTEYDVENDTVILFVNSSADEAEIGVTGTASDLKGYAADDTDGVYFTNALWNGPATGLNVLVVDTTGKFKSSVIADMNGCSAATKFTGIASGVSVEDRDGNTVTTSTDLLVGDTVQVEVTTAGSYTLSNIKIDDGKTGAQTLAKGTYTFVITGASPSIS